MRPSESNEPFRSTEIGELPESWGVLPLGELFDVQQGKALSPSARLGTSPRPFLRTANVLWGRLDLETLDRMDFTSEEAARLSLRSGDLLVCEGGEIGRTAVWRGGIEGCSYQNHVHRLRAKRPDVVPEFVMYWMQAAFIRLGLYSGVGNRTTIPNLSGARLKQLPLPLPPVSEQQAIARVLSGVQAATEMQERIVAALKELKAATMANLFREGLRGEPLKQTEIGEIPESWTVAPLGELCTSPNGFIQTGPFGSQLHASDYVDDGIPTVNPTNMEGGRIQHKGIPRVTKADAERLRRHRLATGDVIFSRRGDVGRHALVSDEENGWLCGTGCLIVRPSHGKVDPSYLAYFLDTQVVQDHLKANAVGSIMPNINTKILKRTPIAVPGLPEQLEIGNLLSVLDRAIRHAIRWHEVLRAHFLSMLERLLSGRIRMPFETSTDTRDASEDAKALERWVSTLIRRFEPERVILFGDPVPGSPKAEGGIGLLVVMPFQDRALAEAVRIQRELQPDGEIDLLVRRPVEVRQALRMGDALIAGIVERGQVLHVRPGSEGSLVEGDRDEAPAHAARQGRPDETTLREVVRRIVAAVEPERVILFGSAARGEMGPDSDLDLLVVKAGDRRGAARTIYEALCGVSPWLPKDVVVVTPEDVERHRDTIGYVIRPALREGRVLYAA